MKQNFTDDDIIRFLYDEMGPSESEAFLDVLCDDEALWERYEHFQEIVKQTSSLEYLPSDHSCQQILAYVKETSIEAELAGAKPATATEKSLKTYMMGAIPFTLSLNAVLILAVVLFASVTITGSVFQMSMNQQTLPDKPLVHQTLEDENLYDWDDTATKREINSISDGLESLRGSSSL